ncbi:Hypothetical protein R9X50_00581400 [Acrodontium crateriforme]|uniref:Hydrophobin n=1 Tax=Acrodontium crateriforme TaxID=150365 RepID=A0AAQ3M796_9PEZI|nr:Hypothetical protein R9X50_00581400 [Acrodontium crateriforme]
MRFITTLTLLCVALTASAQSTTCTSGAIKAVVTAPVKAPSSVFVPVKASSTCTTPSSIIKAPEPTKPCTTDPAVKKPDPTSTPPPPPPPPAHTQTPPPPPPPGPQACGNGQVASCCNTGSANLPVLGGACELAILLGQSCAPNQAFCCDAHQNGLINVGSLCLPITL